MSQIAAHLAVRDLGGAKRYIMYFLVTSLFATFLGAIGELVSLKAENNLYDRLEVEFFLKLTGKDMAFYRDHQAGYLVGLFRQYLDGLLQIVRFIRSDGIRNLVSITLPALVLLFANWQLGLIAVTLMLLQVGYIAWSSSRLNVYRLRSHEIYRRITGEVSDIITNITAFKSSGAETQAKNRIAKLAHEETNTFWLRRARMVTYDVPRDLITAFAVAFSFLIVISTTAGVSASVGLTVLTLTYMFQIVRNVNELPTILVQHDEMITKTYPALAYLGLEHETIRDPEHPQPLTVSQGTIELNHVSFSYPDATGRQHETPVFQDLSLHIKGGEQIGIVGLSGAGKSTLAGLLMRFDDVTSGSICIDGTDIRAVRQADLHRQIAYVPQEPLLFHRTVRDNIAYFDDQATPADIERAAVAAHAHEFINRLPDGYSSMVGERGVKLSGGQKQRVVIARAVLKNAPIMIFDEATSALDTESERIIQRALPQILGRHTAIVIAHRLSTIAALDRILVMHEGHIAEEGTHEQLLAAQGRYYSLWQKQVEHHRVGAPNSSLI